METFELRHLDIISGKQTFEKIIVDGIDILNEFELSLEDRYRGELRTIYAFAKPDGKIVVMGGKKNRQRRDIQRFREIKKQFIKYLQDHGAN